MFHLVLDWSARTPQNGFCVWWKLLVWTHEWVWQAGLLSKIPAEFDRMTVYTSWRAGYWKISRWGQSPDPWSIVFVRKWSPNEFLVTIAPDGVHCGSVPVAPSSVNLILLGLSTSFSLSLVCLSLLISSWGFVLAKMGRGFAHVACSLWSSRIMIDQESTSDLESVVTVSINTALHCHPFISLVSHWLSPTFYGPMHQLHLIFIHIF